VSEQFLSYAPGMTNPNYEMANLRETFVSFIHHFVKADKRFVAEKNPEELISIYRSLARIAMFTVYFFPLFGLSYFANNIAGNIETDKAFSIVEQKFSKISEPLIQKPIVAEPLQKERRELFLSRDVPANLLVMNWHIRERSHPDFYIADLASDILGNGLSSRLYSELVTQKQIFTEISATVSGSFDPGLFSIKGVLQNGIKPEDAEKEVWSIIHELIQKRLRKNELKKVRNKFLTTFLLSSQQVLTRALQFCLAEMEGDANNFPVLYEKYKAISEDDVLNWIEKHIILEKSNVIFYTKK
jgi:zinc protease